MKVEIKERIEQVRRGEIPNQYRRTRAGIMPEDWIKTEPLKAANLFRNHTNKKHGGAFEVLSATQDRGIIPRTEVDIDIKYAEENISGYKKVDDGDFVISLRSFQGGIEYSEYEGLVSPAYTVLKPIRSIVNDYYKAYFKTEDFISRLNATVYGIRDGKQVGYEDFGELVLHYPPTDEQEKIAEILTHCDTVIELKKQFIEEKRRQKKYLMQNLLNPDKGVRLPGFEGKWLKKTLKTLCTEIIDGDWIESKDQSDSGIRLIQTGNIGIGSFLDKFERAKYISEDTFARLHCTEVLNGDILISRLPDPIGRACIISSRKERAITAVDCSIVRLKAKLVAEYFIQYACSDAYFKQIAVLSGGSTRTRISRKEIEKLKISLPGDIKEQIAISTILSTADREIDLLEQELTQWQAKKKSLMQLLLTGLVRVKI